MKGSINKKDKCIDVRGREEHEELLNDPKRCVNLGLDPIYERMVYLSRWGGWLNDEEPDGMD